MIRWNCKGDASSNLHGVYTNDFTILIKGEIRHSDMRNYEIRVCASTVKVHLVNKHLAHHQLR